MGNKHMTDRDISWLSFNERVLQEAARPEVPLLERLKFLSIYSSNLDEFYRVRIPALIALRQIDAHAVPDNIPEVVNNIIARQQQQFGKLFREELLPLLRQQHIHFLYREPIPEALRPGTRNYFLTKVAAFIQSVHLAAPGDFFPENNKIYLAARTVADGQADTLIINIPSADCGRFYTETIDGLQYVVMMDDIIRDNLQWIVPGASVTDCYSFKVTRDAELDLEDEFKGDIADKIEQQITVRDFGLATRLLYDTHMPKDQLQELLQAFLLGNAVIVEGGVYHNLKDLVEFPVKSAALSYERWPSLQYPLKGNDIFEQVATQDVLLHVPYQSYDTLLQFFNQAALDPQVTDISVTLYRIAGDSLIANALISAAKNGKDVTVFVELKARFDEANNIRWAKKMKAAGVKIIYSIPALKVHAKVALVKRREGERVRYFGVLATGNFNESTARFYTDHILLTANGDILRELELLFLFLAKRRKPEEGDTFPLQHLLIAQFNLQERFLDLIERETMQARQGKPAAITIKLNNLEESVMIHKLYEASQAGVEIRLIIRGICRLQPGVPGLSERISVRRIVDRYLEHGRIFVFHNAGDPLVFLGSADWMNRNIYRRIEVCFPLYNDRLKAQIIAMIDLQWQDTASAVAIDAAGHNITLPPATGGAIQSQHAIYRMLQTTDV